MESLIFVAAALLFALLWFAPFVRELRREIKTNRRNRQTAIEAQKAAEANYRSAIEEARRSL